MGISGLLPLLKPIQVNRHLSEYSGQTLAVDAYVWLHRGVYACAQDVATGKKTTRYVDYAMSRVRLLRHLKIQPYIVFDGGPLPAKQGTESERRRKRDDYLADAKRFTAEGKHSQARECYVKCVDVTPEMAYQFIKALRAESIQYVVAPYEADAQLAYLERVGLVDGIITEDSDLLVFGCRNVLFKLDTVSCTAISISRSDFGSLAAADSGGISLVGWSDAQFRSMAILSGCDYLPSIPGIGLKTAWSLLRKHKTVEKAIRAVRLDGKKNVPRDYMQLFKMVEKVFLHQRVYDPVKEHLVHLTEVTDEKGLSDTQDAYVGENLGASLAKKIATGEVSPITRAPMVDINPGFVPRALKPLPILSNGGNGRGKNGRTETEANQDIFSFFGSKPKSVVASGGRPQPRNSSTIAGSGNASGKRRLSDFIVTTENQHDENERPAKRPVIKRSKFFASSVGPARDVTVCPGPSRFPSPVASPEAVVLDTGDADLPMDKPNEIAQEEGYLSPTASITRFETPELSSPCCPRRKGNYATCGTEEDNFGADILSSPAAEIVPKWNGIRTRSRVLTPNRAEPNRDRFDIDTEDKECNLRYACRDEEWTDIDCPEADDSFTSTASSSSGIFTPKGREGPSDKREAEIDIYELDEVEDVVDERRRDNVAKGWMKRWAYDRESRPKLRRMETTITVEGRRRPLSQHRHRVVQFEQEGERSGEI